MGLVTRHTDERPLLVELATRDMPKRAVMFPYVFGWCREQGVPVEWLRFAVEPDARMAGGQVLDGVPLGRQDTETLLEHVASFRATNVVFSEIPFSGLVARMEAAAPGVAWTHLSESRAMEGKLSARARRFALAEFFAVPDGEATGAQAAEWERSLLQVARPDFGYRPANAGAHTLPPIPYLVAGFGCTHRSKLTENPCYAELPLPEEDRSYGCTFCTFPKLGPVTLPFEKLAEDLRAMSRTLPQSSEGQLHRLMGDVVLDRIEDLAALLAREEMPRGTWLLDARIERLLRLETAFDRALSSLRGKGQRLQLATVGVESFSGRELLRMNKGVSTRENLAGMAAVLRLRRDHDDVLAFDGHGHFTMIGFSPWTSLEDVALNLDIATFCGVEDLVEGVISSRMRLVPGRPVTLLAEAEGLLRDSFPDPAYETAALKMYGDELPWVFEDPRVDVLCRLLVRFGHTAGRLGDDLTHRVRGLRSAAERRGVRVFGLARRVVAAVGEHVPAGDEGRAALDVLDKVSTELGDAAGTRGAKAGRHADEAPPGWLAHVGGDTEERQEILAAALELRAVAASLPRDPRRAARERPRR